MSPASLRAGDADRDRAVADLRRHHADGRLELSELEDRVARALRARTVDDLDVLFGDLPRAAAPASIPSPAVTPAPAVAGPPAVGPVGRTGFTYSGVLPGPPDLVLRRARQHLGPGLEAAGYTCTAELPHRLTFTRARVPRWAWAVVILVPGPGLVAPFVAEKEVVHVHIDVEARREGTVVTIHGVAPRRLRRALAGLAAP